MKTTSKSFAKVSPTLECVRSKVDGVWRAWSLRSIVVDENVDLRWVCVAAGPKLAGVIADAKGGSR